MDVDLDFCLKRFADEQLGDSIKYVSQLERNLERKRVKIAETSQLDGPTISEQDNIRIEQFSSDLTENSMAINKTRQIIEDGFRKTLDDMKVDIANIAQISSTRNNNQENDEEIRTASNKIRLQIARIDSELTHLFNMIDYKNSVDCSLRILPWFRVQYGFVNELKRIVGTHNSSGDLLAFSEKSPLMQCICKRVRLWNSREKLIMKFTQQMDENSVTSKHLIDSLYRLTDIPSALKFIQYYKQRRQDERHHREEYSLRKMGLELGQQRIEQQTLAIELVNALCQLSVNSAIEFQLNKKLKKILHGSELSKQFVPILIDQHEEAAADGDLPLIIHLEADRNNWTSNVRSVQERFCSALCKTMQLPADSLKIERVETGSVILHIRISPPCRQSIINQISRRERDHESGTLYIQKIQQCCAKFDSRVLSIVLGADTLPIEKRLMELKWNEMCVNNCGSTDNICCLDSSDQENKQFLCPEGWKRYNIKVADDDAHFEAKWGSWNIAYHGTQGSYAPFILTSGFRVSTQRYCIPENDQAICLSPSIEYSAHPQHARPWKRVLNNGEKYQYYQLVFQCRVNPAAVGDARPETLLHKNHKTTQIDKNFRNEELEWIIQANTATQEYVRDNIVCYGLMVRVIDSEPRDLPILNWWKNSDGAEY